MSIPKLKRVVTTDRITNQIQDHIITTLNPVISNPILDGNFIKRISLKSGQDNLVNHGLGRNYISFWVCRPDAASSIFETPSPSPDQYMILRAISNVTIDLYVF